ncbi:hypothetical protein GCM10009609_66360 [Pseudonocardia aurantiaca]
MPATWSPHPPASKGPAQADRSGVVNDLRPGVEKWDSPLTETVFDTNGRLRPFDDISRYPEGDPLRDLSNLAITAPDATPPAETPDWAAALQRVGVTIRKGSPLAVGGTLAGSGLLRGGLKGAAGPGLRAPVIEPSQQRDIDPVCSSRTRDRQSRWSCRMSWVGFSPCSCWCTWS